MPLVHNFEIDLQAECVPWLQWHDIQHAILSFLFAFSRLALKPSCFSRDLTKKTYETKCEFLPAWAKFQELLVRDFFHLAVSAPEN